MLSLCHITNCNHTPIPTPNYNNSRRRQFFLFDAKKCNHALISSCLHTIMSSRHHGITLTQIYKPHQNTQGSRTHLFNATEYHHTIMTS